MATRADFYVGKGKDAEWLGSITHEGYPDGIEREVLMASTEAEFREKVEEFLRPRRDATWPKDGWPWPWVDSGTTDYSYAWDAKKQRVDGTAFGYGWWPATQEPEDEEDDPATKVAFPNMEGRMNVAPAGSHRSGVILLRRLESIEEPDANK